MAVRYIDADVLDDLAAQANRAKSDIELLRWCGEAMRLVPSRGWNHSEWDAVQRSFDTEIGLLENDERSLRDRARRTRDAANEPALIRWADDAFRGFMEFSQIAAVERDIRDGDILNLTRDGFPLGRAALGLADVVRVASRLRILRDLTNSNDRLHIQGGSEMRKVLRLTSKTILEQNLRGKVVGNITKDALNPFNSRLGSAFFVLGAVGTASKYAQQYGSTSAGSVVAGTASDLALEYGANVGGQWIGATAGAALGAPLGPVGVVIGANVGRVVGGWAGQEAAHWIEDQPEYHHFVESAGHAIDDAAANVGHTLDDIGKGVGNFLGFK